MNAEQRERHAKIVDLWSQHGGGYSTVFGGGIKAALIPVDQLYEFADALIAAEREDAERWRTLVKRFSSGKLEIRDFRSPPWTNAQMEIDAIRARSQPAEQREG